jgi:hypothetical protein
MANKGKVAALSADNVKEVVTAEAATVENIDSKTKEAEAAFNFEL